VKAIEIFKQEGKWKAKFESAPGRGKVAAAGAAAG
jgi:hypothetical protein